MEKLIELLNEYELEREKGIKEFKNWALPLWEWSIDYGDLVYDGVEPSMNLESAYGDTANGIVKARKSKKHSDGKYCFDRGGEWFIVGIDTPKGSYTYHYETDKYWNLFKCKELELGKERDGHTEKDVDRLLYL